MHRFQEGRAGEKRTSISCACVYNCVRTYNAKAALKHVVRIRDPLHLCDTPFYLSCAPIVFFAGGGAGPISPHRP